MTGYERKRREFYKTKFKLTSHTKPHLMLPCSLMDQLDKCKDDASRRLILGVSRKKHA